MSIHPSLKAPAQDKQQRSVLKRIERLKTLLEKGLWHEGDSVFSLPKTKIFRLKIKKEKAVEKKPAEGTAEGEAATTDTASPTET